MASDLAAGPLGRLAPSMQRLWARQLLVFLAAATLLVLAFGAAWKLANRPSSQPLHASGNLLVNPGFQQDADDDGRADGWDMGPGAELGDWLIHPQDGGHSLRLTGSASYVRSSRVWVWPGKRYELSLQALTDSDWPGRLQLVFLWENSRREVICRQESPWQEVPARQWRRLEFAAWAPQDAAGLALLLRPAGDQPLYLDDLRLGEQGVRLEPFPDYARAALAFTLDWETAMGGLIHSRSDDSYDPTTAEQRGLAMRQGTEELLALFERYDVRATWYAAGYSLLPGNAAAQSFSGDPAYPWASAEHGWPNDRWLTTPWFADDPHGTAQSHPAWYFGDLVPRLLEAGQDIQSHTFGHLYLGYVSPEELRRDLQQWNEAAEAAGVPAAQSLAFPWGASLGLSDAGYEVLEELGYIAVTRTYHAPQGRSQYWIIPPDDLFHLYTVPGHPRLWAFPDHYFPAHADDPAWAKEVVNRVLLERGVSSLWAHSEEAVSAEQLAAWEEVLAYAAERRQEGLWIAPLTDIVRFRQDLAGVDLDSEGSGHQLQLTVHNGSDHVLAGLTLTLPHPVREASLNGAPYEDFRLDQVRLPALGPGQRVQLQLVLSNWEPAP
ncbi:MAG: polysaccharide deacetylase family protein [Chloroflexia bacterium]|nr:polysaccharide deacetylase family protein [Chloroflexia bacterium]